MLGRLLAPEARVVNQDAFFGGDGDWNQTRSGVTINRDTAFKIGAVYAAVRLIADTISTLPMDTFFRSDGARYPYRPRPAWVDKPEPDRSVSRSDHFQMLLVSLLIDGNAFIRKLKNDTGEIIALSVMDPTRVEVRRNPVTGRINFVIDSGVAVLTEDEIIHITELRRPGGLRGVSKIEELKETLGLSKALEDFSAAFFGNGANPGVVISFPQEVNDTQADLAKRSWSKKHRGLKNAHEASVVSGGATVTKIGVDPNEAQMLESREFAVEEICRIFRIPLPNLQSTKQGATGYAQREQDAIQLVTFTLMFYISKIEDAYTELIPGGGFLKFNVDGLQRADFVARWQAYSIAIQAGLTTINRVNKLEDLPPVDGGDVYRVPMALMNLDAANLVGLQKQVEMARVLIDGGFQPEDALKAVGLDPIKHTGIPTRQLQQIQLLDPTDPLADISTK